MANQVYTFMAKDDEVAFLRVLERYVLEVYPRRVPQDWVTFRATLAAHDRLPEEELYLVASDIGPAEVDVVKRGKDKGSWRINEVSSPVIFWERNRFNDEGEMVAGQLWAELDVTPQTGRRDSAPSRFRDRYLEIEEWMRKTFRKGDPKGFLVGPAAARLVKEGKLKLRENKHFGREVFIHR